MMIKSYTASSVPEALRLVKEDLGTEAVILDTRHENTADSIGRVRGRRVVVTAAVDEDESPREGKHTLTLKGPISESKPSEIETKESEIKAPGDHEIVGAFDQRLDRIEHALESLNNNEIRRMPQGEYSIASEGNNRVMVGFRRWLHDQRELVGRIGEAYATSLIDKMPSIQRFLETISNDSTVLFVGPRGAGKSTALFKALALRWRENKIPAQIAVIGDEESSNDHRLAKLAELFDLSFHRVARPEDYRRERNSARGPAPSFVEYATPLDPTGIQKSARSILRKVRPDLVVLTLHAGMRPAMWQDALTHFSALSPKCVLFTHFDETQPWWDICEFAMNFRLALSYRTAGFEPCDEIQPFLESDLRAGLTDTVDGLLGHVSTTAI